MPHAERLVGLDLLRVALIALVICHHLACAIGAGGLWYYVLEPPQSMPAVLLFTMFTSVNQSFFMSLLFFVSGYFTAPSYDRKGAAAFLKDRGIRLGIPLLVYFFLLNPHVEFLARHFSGEANEGYLAWMQRHWLAATGSGPLWFVLTLLIFTCAYAAWCAARPPATRKVRAAAVPDHGQILGFVIAAGVVAFALRLAFPVGTEVFNLQLGYFALYASFFALGVVAYRRSWLDQLDQQRVRPWFGAAVALVVVMPVIYAVGGGDGEPEAFYGGWTWQAFAYAAWEPVLCVGISLKLLSYFMSRFRQETPLGARASRSSYTAYIIHPFFVIVGTAWLASPAIDPILKFAVLCPVAVVACFVVSDFVRRAPLVRRVV